ncbi:MAG: HlyD family type I secretion periplasmic adaptor subunit [Aestuariivirga sp.]
MKALDTDRSLRRFQLLGYASIFLMAGIFGGWAASTNIEGAVIAPATIIAESNTKRIQHKEGGIVRKILVKDGDRVVEGQDLVILDDTETRSELAIVDSLLVEELAKRARLEAQRDGLAAPQFPPEILSWQNEPEVARIMQGQLRLFTARSDGIRGKKEQLDQQIAQIGEQIAGMQAQIAAQEQQIELVGDELVGLHDLLGQGLVAKSRVLAMEREQARLEGANGELIASKAGAANKISEIRLQILQIGEEDRTQSLTELRETEGRIAEFRERKLAAAARLGRMVIKAPIGGDIYDLALHTIGGVIQPAETLMLIAPEADELVLLAQVPPQNIDQIAPGQQARVRFQTFNQRLTPEVGAEVTQIAADTSRIDQNSPPFYAVRLRIRPEELAKLAGSKLKPGMPAEAFISTSERSPLSYLLKPLTDQIAHTFRE